MHLSSVQWRQMSSRRQRCLVLLHHSQNVIVEVETATMSRASSVYGSAMRSHTYLFLEESVAWSHYPTFGSLHHAHAVSKVPARCMWWQREKSARQDGNQWQQQELEKWYDEPSPCTGKFRFESRGEDMLGMT